MHFGGWINARDRGSRVFEPGPGDLLRLPGVLGLPNPAKMEACRGEERGDQTTAHFGFGGDRQS